MTEPKHKASHTDYVVLLRHCPCSTGSKGLRSPKPKGPADGDARGIRAAATCRRRAHCGSYYDSDAVSIETLTAGRDARWASCNIYSTQDYCCRGRRCRIPVFAVKVNLLPRLGIYHPHFRAAMAARRTCSSLPGW